jgi:hypothetical protein
MARELIGDINNDGKINMFDVFLIFAKNSGVIEFNSDEIDRGDVVNYDGVVGIPDAARIRRHITGQELITYTITNI